eukprot:Clim_evm64s172 gene=Clim_evmTU64s172
MEDPFFVVKKNVEDALQQSRQQYQRWQHLFNAPTAGTYEEFEWTTNDLKNNLRSIEWDVDDLEETIAAVEKNPLKFNVSPHEVAERKAFVQDTRREISRISAALTSTKAKNKHEQTGRSALMGTLNQSNGGGGSRANGKYKRLEEELERDNDRYMNDQFTEQQMMYREQDQQLTHIGQSLGRMKVMGAEMGTELDHQAVLMDDLGDDIEVADSRLKTLAKRVDKLLMNQDDKKQTCTIIVLIVVLIVLITVYSNL